MPGVASVLFHLKDEVFWSDLPRGFGLAAKLIGSVLIVLVTEGIGIVFVILELLESMLPDKSKFCLIHGPF